MNIMDLFKTAPTVTTPATNGTGAGNTVNATNTNNTGSMAPAATIDPATGQIPGTALTPVNPLDAYKKMLDNADKSGTIQAPSFKLDPKVLEDVSKSMDFTKGLDSSLLENALKGDAKSLLQVIQSVGQNSYRASIEHNTALTETHLGQRSAYDNSRVTAGVKTQLTSDALSSAPNYDHPVVKAELNRIAGEFARSNPDASPQQVAKAAQQYINDLNAALTPAKKSSDGSNSEGEFDWSKYLTK